MKQIALAAAASLLLLSSASAQDAKKKPKRRRTYDLRASYKAKVGSKIKAVNDTKIEMLVNVKRRGNPLRIENKTSGYELRYTDEVKKHPRDGDGIFRVLRTYTSTKNYQTGQIDRSRRKVLLTWTKEGLHYDESEVAQLPEDARGLLNTEKRRPQGVLDYLIPSRRKAVGDAWRIPNDKAMQLFLLDPKDLVDDASKCYGKLLGTRPATKRQPYEKVRMALVFKLAFKGMHGFVFDEAAKIKVITEILTPANGESPAGKSKGLGEITGEGHHPDHPKDVTVEFTIRVATLYETKLAR